jgi:competence protein ComEA
MAEVKAWFAAQSKQTQYKIIALGLTLVVVFSLVLSDQGSASTENAISPVTTAEPAIAKTLLVHVVGEVRRPGIFELELGARVADALESAGGFTADAIEESVNLARVLGDGEQIVVRSVHQLAEEDPIISLNRSSARQLETLPGVGPALAGRIIDWREQNGGFSAVEQLLEVSGIGAKLFENLKALVTL